MRTAPCIMVLVGVTVAIMIAGEGRSQGLALPPPARPASITIDAAAADPADDAAPGQDASSSVDSAAGREADAEASQPDLPPFTAPLISSARAQVGVTRHYDPSYVSLDYPGGDVPRDRGVCTDVLIRAMRDGAAIDLQLAVNRDMKANFAAYPRNWGLSRTDANIDHRRVPNLATLLRRLGAELPPDEDPAAFLPGDIVTMMLPGNLPHILLVSDTRSRDGARPLVIHNIGRGTQEEDALFAYPHTGHFRLSSDALAELRRLGQLEY